MAIIVQQSLVSVPARAFVERFEVNNSFETVGVSLGLDTLLQQRNFGHNAIVEASSIMPV